MVYAPESPSGEEFGVTAQRHLAVQYAVSRVLLDAATVDEAAPRLLQAIGEGLAWDWGALWSIAPAANTLRCATTWHALDIAAAEFDTASRQTDFAPGVGLPGRVWMTGEPAWIPDVRHDSNIPRLAVATKVGLHGGFAFPLRSEGGVLGVIEFFSRGFRPPDEDVLRMVATLGNQIGQFIERKQAEETLRFQARLLDAVEQAVIVTDPDGRISHWNRFAERLYGWPAADVLGRQILEVAPAATTREQAAEILAHVRAGGHWSGEVLVRRRDRTAFPALVTASPLSDDDGALVGIIGVAIDITAHRRAEEALRESEARKAAIVETALDCIITMDDAGRVIEFNPAAEQTFGYPRTEALGKPLADLIIPPRFREQHWRGLARYLATGEGPLLNKRLELTAMRADGTEFPVELAITPLHHTGRPLFTGVLRDITERQRAERERQQFLARERAARAEAERAAGALQRLQTITEVALNHVVLDDLLDALLDRLRDLLAADTAACLLLSPDEQTLVARAAKGLEEEVERGVRIPVGQGFAGRIAAERRPIIIEDVEHADVVSPLLREKGVRSLLGAPLLVDRRVIGIIHVGTLRPRRFTAEEARLLQLVADRAGVAIDHARLYQAERQARSRAEAAQRRLSFLAKASMLLSASLDYEPTLQQVAQLAVPALADWCWVDVVEADGAIHPVAVAHSDPEKVEWLRALRARSSPTPQAPPGVSRVLRSGRSELMAAVPDPALLADDGEAARARRLREVGVTSYMIVPLVARDQTLGAITLVSAESGYRYTPADLALAEDLARRAAVAVDNARLYQEAQEAIGLRDQFLSIASHELRTPVTAIKGYAELLLRRQERGRLTPERLADALRAIDDTSDRLERLTQDLLDVSRSRMGQLLLRPQPLDLAALVRTVTSRYRDRLDQRHRLRVDLQTNPCPVVADPDRIEQVLANLLENAAKYSPDGGEIGVTLSRDDDGVVLAVRDPGIGVPPDALEAIFAPFGRAPNATQRQLPGLGLGLYICREIIERHGGHIWAESVGEGHGTTMRLWLPVRSVDGAEQQGPS